MSDYLEIEAHLREALEFKKAASYYLFLMAGAPIQSVQGSTTPPLERNSDHATGPM
jgi:hypothetical protein